MGASLRMTSDPLPAILISPSTVHIFHMQESIANWQRRSGGPFNEEVTKRSQIHLALCCRFYLNLAKNQSKILTFPRAIPFVEFDLWLFFQIFCAVFVHTVHTINKNKK